MKFITGLLLGFLLFPIACEINQYNDYKYRFFMVPRYGVTDVITGKCMNVPAINGHGHEIKSLRNYFNCNKVQIYFSDLIHGEK